MQLGLQVVVALGLLVFVHELGHFLAAKWAGVRVEVFSFGFGPFLLSYKRGETIYAVSLIPFGGYVRMTGQADLGSVKDREKHVPWSYMAKSPQKRAVIIVAGVTMNVIFAYFVFVAALLSGYSDIPAEVGEIRNKNAIAAGLREGDRILEVNGSRVTRWLDVESAVATSQVGTVTLLVERDGRDEPFELAFESFESERTGLATLGLDVPRANFNFPIGASDSQGLGVWQVSPGTPGDMAGLEQFDYIDTVDGVAFAGLEGFRSALRAAADVELGVTRGDEKLTLRVRPRAVEGGRVVGIELAERVIAELTPGSPAAVAGLQKGDRVDTVDGAQLLVSDGFRDALSASAEVELGVTRGGERHALRVTPRPVEGGYIVGFQPAERVVAEVTPGSPADEAGLEKGDYVTEIVRTGDPRMEMTWTSPDGEEHTAIIPFSEGALAYDVRMPKQEPVRTTFLTVWADAASESLRAIGMTYDVLAGLLSGVVPVKQMSGPVSIVKMTYRSAKSGFSSYFWLVAVISVNLAVINLFPMLPLDGGLLLFLLYEGLRGRPANPKFQETAQLVGAVLLLVLIIYVTTNDIGR